jgi:hypothetical protein
MSSVITNVLDAPRTLGCQPVSAQASAFADTEVYALGDLVRYENILPPVPPANYSLVKLFDPLTSKEYPLVQPAPAWEGAGRNYPLGARVSYPLTGASKYNYINVGAGNANNPPTGSATNNQWWNYVETVGALNSEFWALQRDGEPWWDSGAQYYPGDVVSYSATLGRKPVMYQSLTKNVASAPEVEGSDDWKPLADGFVSSVVAGVGGTAVYGNVVIKGITGVNVGYDSSDETVAVSNDGALSVVGGGGVGVAGVAIVGSQAKKGAITLTNLGVTNLASPNLSIGGITGGGATGNVGIRLKEAQVIVSSLEEWVNTNAYTRGTGVKVTFNGQTSLYVCYLTVPAPAGGSINPTPDSVQGKLNWGPIGNGGRTFVSDMTVGSGTPTYLTPAYFPTSTTDVYSGLYDVNVYPGLQLTNVYPNQSALIVDIAGLASQLCEFPVVALPTYSLPTLPPAPPAPQVITYTPRLGSVGALCPVLGSCDAGLVRATVLNLSLDPATPSIPVPSTGKIWIFNALLGHFA